MEMILIIIIVIIGFVVLGYLITKKQSVSADLVSVMNMLQQTSAADRHSLNSRLDQVQKSLGEMSEIGRSMRDLQNFLASPKLRGNLGEHVLKDLLAQMLPGDAFYLQYSFKSGQVVDAAIKTSGGIIPIDSKFPMENFRKMSGTESTEGRQKAQKDFEKDVKNHIDAISKKYIVTDEGTIDYALMYIPSEAVYYEIVNNTNLFDYSADRRVLPVSPTTFYAYLRAILASFEGQKVEAKAREILASIKAIAKDYERVEEDLSVLQRHLNSAYNKMGDVFSSFGKLGGKISQTKNLGGEEKKKLVE